MLVCYKYQQFPKQVFSCSVLIDIFLRYWYWFFNKNCVQRCWLPTIGGNLHSGNLLDNIKSRVYLCKMLGNWKISWVKCTKLFLDILIFNKICVPRCWLPTIGGNLHSGNLLDDIKSTVYLIKTLGNWKISLVQCTKLVAETSWFLKHVSNQWKWCILNYKWKH